jgi:hypothetical protein
MTPSFMLCPLLAGWLLAACTSAQSSVEHHDAGPIDGSEVGTGSDTGTSLFPSQLPDDFRCDPTLDSIREGIFVTSCSFYTCHDNVDAAWGLHLTYDVEPLARELIDQPAGSCTGWKLVVPGAPEKSLLYNKVSNATPACGERMPRGAVPLPDDALDCIRGWIAGLSRDN